MAEITEELNLSELDDGYLKVLLLLSARRAASSEPRRAGFWHGLAGILSTEQESRQAMADFEGQQSAEAGPEEIAELEAIVDELRRDLTSLESEYRAAYGQMPTPGSEAQSQS